ncbi:MAG TPA: uracil-DNA glycosylase family protein [Gaiellaceae bacterium]|nr:uracil-DNA glycosylase family protein [Gaiellaceae bacterium]
MRPSAVLECVDFPCTDVVHDLFVVPRLDVEPDRIDVVMVSEAAPASLDDWFYAGGDALFAQTTVQAFRDAGEDVSTISDVLALGVYLTTAVKCGKTGYAISTPTVKACSSLLETELGLFPNASVLMLMGDVAIKAVNAIARRNGEPRVIPSGPTYKIRGGAYRFRDLKVLPSYVQAGPSFFIEKRKREMIAEDIAAALAFVRALRAA